MSENLPVNPPPASALVRVLIVDDHPIVRDGLVAKLDSDTGFVVCGEAEDVLQALEQIELLAPDLVVVDISLARGNGIELIKRIRERYGSLPILVWSMYQEVHYAERALRAGAQGYLHKGRATREIVDALRAVMAGNVYLSGAQSEQLLKRVVGRKDLQRSPIDSLSDRELEAFELMGQGLSTEEVASRMHISAKTVETYRLRIKEKLGIVSLPELIRRATEWVLHKE